MSKEENVVKYYVLCNRLKNVIRTGWNVWHVQRERIESVAEHIYGVQMVAIAMKSEYQYDIDMMKVICMLAVHELGEVLIGDLVPFDASKTEKAKMESEAVHKVLVNLLDREQVQKLYDEFDACTTKEAIFANQCDKFEACLQCKLYDEEGCVDMNKQEGNKAVSDEKYVEILKSNPTWSESWFRFWEQIYPFDDNFKAVLDYAINNDIKE